MLQPKTTEPTLAFRTAAFHISETDDEATRAAGRAAPSWLAALTGATALAWPSLALAQDGGDAPSLAGSAPPAGGNGVIGGGGAPPPGAQPPAAGQNYLFLMLGGFFVLWIVMMVMGQRREAKKRQTLIDSLKKHDRVQTTGGMIGTIVEIKPDTIVLKVDENSNTRVTFTKGAIVGVIKEAPAGKDGGSDPGSKGTGKA